MLNHKESDFSEHQKNSTDDVQCDFISLSATVSML
jgi:hypothetical protein